MQYLMHWQTRRGAHVTANTNDLGEVCAKAEKHFKQRRPFRAVHNAPGDPVDGIECAAAYKGDNGWTWYSETE
jgi:hypothetical protein